MFRYVITPARRRRHDLYIALVIVDDPDNLDLEDGSGDLLLEDGDRILVEEEE